MRDDQLPHVCFITQWYPNPDDPQLGNFIKKQAEAAALGSIVSVMYVRSSLLSEPSVQINRNGNLLEVVATYRRSNLLPLRMIRHIKGSLAAYRKIQEMHGKPDLINFCILPLTYLQTYWIKGLKNIPFVVTEHWSGYSTGLFKKKHPWLQRLTRKIVRSARKVIVVSRTLNDAMAANKLPGDYVIIPNIIELEAQEKISSDVRTIVVVADLVDQIKNISGIIQSFMDADFGSVQVELIIGGGGPDEKMLREKASKSKKKINFTGRLLPEEVPNLLAKADLVVVNSYHETFSMITAEAFAAGVPVIATRCGGPEEIISENTGILINSGDNDALRQAMETAVAQPEKFDRKEMQSIIGKFRKEEVGQLWCKEFKTAISDRT